MNDIQGQDWSNYWRGRSGQNTGEAFVGAGIEKNDTLKQFWNKTFQNVPLDKKFLDVACGAGSVLRHASGLGFENLTGLDIAPEAINVLKQTLPNVQGVVSAVVNMPFEDDSFDFVTSQFGFEYAGSEAGILQSAEEVIRILKPSGNFTAVTHIQGGAIERESLAALEQINFVKSSGFIEAAKNMFNAASAAEGNCDKAIQDAFFSVLTQMNKSETQLVSWVQSQETSNFEFAKYISFLISSTRQAFEHRASIPLEDNLAWLDDMSLEVEAYKGRMETMVQSALSHNVATLLLSLFKKVGFNTKDPTPLYFEDKAVPIAWVLTTTP